MARYADARRGRPWPDRALPRWDVPPDAPRTWQEAELPSMLTRSRPQLPRCPAPGCPVRYRPGVDDHLCPWHQDEEREQQRTEQPALIGLDELMTQAMSTEPALPDQGGHQ